jgi:hypothetical protein
MREERELGGRRRMLRICEHTDDGRERREGDERCSV